MWVPGQLQSIFFWSLTKKAEHDNLMNTSPLFEACLKFWMSNKKPEFHWRKKKKCQCKKIFAPAVFFFSLSIFSPSLEVPLTEGRQGFFRTCVSQQQCCLVNKPFFSQFDQLDLEQTFPALLTCCPDTASTEYSSNQSRNISRSDNSVIKCTPKIDTNNKMNLWRSTRFMWLKLKLGTSQSFKNQWQLKEGTPPWMDNLHFLSVAFLAAHTYQSCTANIKTYFASRVLNRFQSSWQAIPYQYDTWGDKNTGPTDRMRQVMRKGGGDLRWMEGGSVQMRETLYKQNQRGTVSRGGVLIGCSPHWNNFFCFVFCVQQQPLEFLFIYLFSATTTGMLFPLWELARKLAESFLLSELVNDFSPNCQMISVLSLQQVLNPTQEKANCEPERQLDVLPCGISDSIMSEPKGLKRELCINPLSHNAPRDFILHSGFLRRAGGWGRKIADPN